MTKTPIELVEKWRKESNLLSDQSCDASNGRKPFTAERLRTNSAYVSICANELESALAAQWISVDDRLPETVADYFIRFKNESFGSAHWNGEWFDYDSDAIATHWQPITPLPEKKS